MTLAMIWIRVLLSLYKKRLPEWLTVAELTKLSRNGNWKRVQNREKVNFKNVGGDDPDVYGKKRYVQRLLDNWMDAGFVKRRRRENNGRGGIPYEYSLTDLGRKYVRKKAEKKYSSETVKKAALT